MPPWPPRPRGPSWAMIRMPSLEALTRYGREDRHEIEDAKVEKNPTPSAAERAAVSNAGSRRMTCLIQTETRPHAAA